MKLSGLRLQRWRRLRIIAAARLNIVGTLVSKEQ